MNLSISPQREDIKKSFTQEEINEIVDGLINDEIKIESVPSYLHPQLFTPLSLARIEAKHGNFIEQYNHLTDIMYSLRLSLVQPDISFNPTLTKTYNSTTQRSIDSQNLNISNFSRSFQTQSFSSTSPISLITAVQTTNLQDEPTAVRRRNGKIDTINQYYDNEEKRMKDLKAREYNKLVQSHKSEVISTDINTAKRQADNYEIKLADFREKWDREFRKIKQERQKEIDEAESEFDNYFPNLSARAQTRPTTARSRPTKEQLGRTLKSARSQKPKTKKFSQTLQPRVPPNEE